MGNYSHTPLSGPSVVTVILHVAPQNCSRVKTGTYPPVKLDSGECQKTGGNRLKAI